MRSIFRQSDRGAGAERLPICMDKKNMSEIAAKGVAQSAPQPVFRGEEANASSDSNNDCKGLSLCKFL